VDATDHDALTSPANTTRAVRVFEHQRVWRLAPEVFTEAAALIAANEPRPDVVVGIARGGMPLARALAEHYHVPVAELPARHNESDALYLPASGTVRLPQEPTAGLREIEGARLLVVDDICGTGATHRAVLAWLCLHLATHHVRTAALCRSRASDFTPDIWVWDTLDWVVFPWNETADTSQDLLVPLRPRGPADTARRPLDPPAEPLTHDIHRRAPRTGLVDKLPPPPAPCVDRPAPPQERV